MVKALAAGTKDANSKNMNTPKQGFVQKKKDPKFKQTPTGKVSLINGSKNNGNTKQHDSSKRKSGSPQKTPEKNKEQKKKNSPKSDQKPQQSPKAELKKKTDDEDDTDSEEDINEGIELEEEKSMVVDSDGSEGESDDDSDEENVPNILGASLADESDEDDEDFEEEEENNAQINKGVKMFKGLKSNDKSTDSDKTDADSSGSEVSVDEDEEVDDDDDDDDSDEEVEGEDDDDDDEDEDEDDDEESDDDEDDEESDEEEGDGSKLGLKALLGNSIADEDDDDDEDFVHTEGNEEDDDMSDEEEDEEEEQNDNGMVESPEKNKKDKDVSIEDFKADKKTIFVGNLPKDVKKKSLLKLFKQFGSIEALRLRGIVGKTVNVPKKVAAKTNMLHPRLKSVYAYIRFDSEKSVDAALSMNGKEFEEHYLRVDRACKSDVAPNPKKSVFVGNLNFTIDDNTLRKHFEGCGEIESVRLVRDNKTGIGRGIGYVNFKNEDGAALALELNGTSIANREIRVQPWSEKDKQTKASRGKRSHSAEGKNSGSSKKFKNNAQKTVQNQNKDNTNKKNQKEQKFEGKQPSPQKASPFQGQKVDGHKKKRKNRSDRKKKFLAEKLTAKPKKPAN